MKTKLSFLVLLVLVAVSAFSQQRVELKLPNPCVVTPVSEPDYQAPQLHLDIQLSPNPNNGSFSLKIDNQKQLGFVVLSVYNAKGTLVYSDEFYCNNRSCIKYYDLQKLPKSVYIVCVKSSNKVVQEKMIIE